jgi:hypothetical protein
MTSDTKTRITESLNRLRALVGYLGEKERFGWWDTSFLNRTGLQFLEINFPRTAFAAGCKGVMEAAKRLHDERIGKGGVYHLFRLPTGFEEDLHHALIAADPGDLLPLLESSETALEALRSMVADTVGAPEGPVQIGTLKGALRPADIQEIAVHYYDAFRNRKMCFPYFAAER